MVSVGVMDPDEPLQVGAALRSRGYLLSSWPWRATAYLATTIPLAGVVCAVLLVVMAPVLAVAGALRQGRPIDLLLVVLLALPSFLVLLALPLLAVAVAAVERWRLALVDVRPLARKPLTGVVALYATPAGGRQVAHTVFMGVVMPLVLAFFTLLVALDLALIASPWVAGRASRVDLVFTTVTTPAQAAPLAVIGLAGLAGLGYLAGVVAAAQGAVTRWLLAGTREEGAMREVARSRARLVDAYERERVRIERDVHDGALPRLTSLSLQLGLARLDVAEDSPAAGPLAIAHQQAQALMVALRAIVDGLRPQDLVELGLVGAVQELARALPIPVDVHADLPGPAPETVETIAYFAVCEALGNLARHAGASRAAVKIVRAGRDLVVEVSDDGVGGARPEGGSGLTGLADRVHAVGGRVLVSSPPGGPTLVRVELPWRG